MYGHFLGEIEDAANEQLPLLVIITPEIPIHLSLRAIPRKLHIKKCASKAYSIIYPTSHCDLLETSTGHSQRRNVASIRLAKRTKAQAAR